MLNWKAQGFISYYSNPGYCKIKLLLMKYTDGIVNRYMAFASNATAISKCGSSKAVNCSVGPLADCETKQLLSVTQSESIAIMGQV